MGADENKAAYRRFVDEVWNKGNFSVAEELMARDLVDHSQLPGLPQGIDGFRALYGMYKGAFPDLHFNLEDVLAEGDKVVGRWSTTGTHQGELMGVPPTGRQATVTGIEITRFANGKMVEHWSNYDLLGLLQQLGAVPTPGQGNT